MATLGKMRFTLEDIKRQFDSKSYSLGLAYAQKKRVVQIQRSGNLIRAKVQESNNTAYYQNIFVKSTTSGIQFQGTCSCPEVLNCHHVVAVLLSIVRHDELSNRDAALNSPLAGWVNKLYQTLNPNAPEALVAKVAQQDLSEKLLKKTRITRQKIPNWLHKMTEKLFSVLAIGEYLNWSSKTA